MSAIEGTIARFQSLADGTIRYIVDVSPANDRHEFHAPHAAVALALMVDPVIEGQFTSIGEAGESPAAPPAIPEQDVGNRLPTPPSRHPYGHSARLLKLSGFCRSPDVWRAVGTDEEFLRWVRTQPCVLADGNVGPCGGDIIAAHVRRIANGAGMGRKPPYSAVTLCTQHHDYQHQHGEESLAPKAQWDEWRIEFVEQWCWETLRERLGYGSMGDVPPAVLYAWAERHNIDRYLPLAYRQ
jgi:hypothetical protein